MNRKEELLAKMKLLENQLEPLKQELNKIFLEESEEVKEKVKRCEQLKDKFEIEDLVFSAHDRCLCGAGLAYPKNIGMHGSWICSDILLGTAIPANKEGAKEHNGEFPFAFYNIKSENQPSANGATTRPNIVCSS